MGKKNLAHDILQLVNYKVKHSKWDKWILFIINMLEKPLHVIMMINMFQKPFEMFNLVPVWHYGGSFSVHIVLL